MGGHVSSSQSTVRDHFQAGHAELLVLIGALEAAGLDCAQRASGGAVGVEEVHVLLVVSRRSCSTCKVALTRLAERLRLKITVAQGTTDGVPAIDTF